MDDQAVIGLMNRKSSEIFGSAQLMTAYNLITPLHRFVIERSADLLVGSRPCGFHCVEMAPRVAASYHGIFRTELLVSRALRVGNSIKSKRLKFLGSIRVHFLTYNFGRPIEL